MEEWIKKSDAIEAIKDNSFALGDDYLEINGYGAIDDIRALPSADRPQGEWIPCSERLPTWGHSYCLITYVTDYSTDILIDCWDDEGKGWCDHQGCGGEVVAWMPLPKPWKGADHEDN